jgi:hypothetical protein
MEVPLLEGRDFEDGDVDGRPKVAIVNRKFASYFFGDRSPICPASTTFPCQRQLFFPTGLIF